MTLCHKISQSEAIWSRRIVKKAVDALGYVKIAVHLGKTPRNVRRWIAGEVKASKSDLMVLEQLYLHLYKPPYICKITLPSTRPQAMASVSGL